MDSHKNESYYKKNFVKKNHLQISKQISYFQHRTLEVFIVLHRKTYRTSYCQFSYCQQNIVLCNFIIVLSIIVLVTSYYICVVLQIIRFQFQRLIILIT